MIISGVGIRIWTCFSSDCADMQHPVSQAQQWEEENLWPDRRRQTGREGWPGAQPGPWSLTPTPRIPLASQHFPDAFANSTRDSFLRSKNGESPGLNSPQKVSYTLLTEGGYSSLYFEGEKKSIHYLCFCLIKCPAPQGQHSDNTWTWMAES